MPGPVPQEAMEVLPETTKEVPAKVLGTLGARFASLGSPVALVAGSIGAFSVPGPSRENAKRAQTATGYV